MIDREILVNEFLDRCEHVLSPPPGTCDECGTEIDPPVNYDRDIVRTALDRLFADLRDFCGEIYADKGRVIKVKTKRKGK